MKQPQTTAPNLSEEVAEEESTAERLTATLDPFDVGALRLSQDFAAEIAVERVLTHIPIRRPNKQDFFRTHPDEAYRLDTTVIELREDRDTYLVPAAFPDRLPSGNHSGSPLHSHYPERHGVPLAVQIAFAGRSPKRVAHVGPRDAAGRAMSQWTRIVADMTAGCYQFYAAAANLPGPEWPDLSFQELLRLGFRDRLIDRPDHPVLERLRGAV